MPDPVRGYSGVSEYTARADHQHKEPSKQVWLPVLKQGATITTTYSGNLVKKSKDKIIDATANIDCSTAGAAANLIEFDLPYAVPVAPAAVGDFVFTDAGVILYVGVLYAITGVRCVFIAGNQTNYLGLAPVYTISIGDSLQLNLHYFSV